MSLLGNQTVPSQLHSIQATQSLYGICIPIIWGQNRVQLNLLWFGDFTSQAPYQSGGKGLGKDGTAYDYHAAILGVLCNGVVSGVGNIWAQNGRLTLQSATQAYTVPSGGGTITVANASSFNSDFGASKATPYSVTANDYGSPGPITLAGTMQTSLVRVLGPPAGGQYSQTAGAYTLSASDAGATVQITYSYSLYVLAETEDYNVPPSGPYEITVQFESQFNADQGVVFIDTGVPLVLTVGSPSAGQYTVTAGNYFFAAADAGKAIAISYTWSQSNSNVDPASTLQFTLIEGTQGQAPWSYLTSNHLSQALGYTGLALVACPNMDLGEAGELPNYNYEVLATLQFGGGVVDAELSKVIADFLTNTLYGAQFTGTIDSSLMGIARDYWNSNSFFVSPVLSTANAAADTIEQWCEAGNTGVFWSEGKLKFIPYGDTTTVANGYVFTPQTNPVVDLDDSDFMQDDSNEDPVKIDRTPWQDAFNEVKIQYTNRANNYNDNTIVEQDDWAIATFGLRPEGQKDYGFLCTLTAATFAANLRLKRLVNIRKKYSFKISGIRYPYLEPMDLVTLTDVGLGLNQEPVRITEIDEDEDRILTITAEEFPWGTAAATLYSKQNANATSQPASLVSPGDTILDDIFEPGERLATTLANSAYQIWMALSGGPNWGGCEVWISKDNQTFQKIPVPQQGATRSGFLTTTLPAGSDPDTTNTPGVSIQGELQSVSMAQADSLATICKVGSEYISYETATFTGTSKLRNDYTLSYLRRGAFSSFNIQHNVNDPVEGTFCRLDDSVYQYSYDLSLYGSTLYFKFLSFNTFENQKQSLADVISYPYIIGGNNANHSMAIDSVLNGGGTDCTVRIYQAGSSPGTNGTIALSTGAVLTLPAVSLTPYSLSTEYFVNFNPSTSTYTLYTDRNAWLIDQSGGQVAIGLLTTVGSTSTVYVPSRYADEGGTTTSNPAGAYDGDPAGAVVSAFLSSNGDVEGFIIYYGFANIAPAALTLTVTANTSNAFGTSFLVSLDAGSTTISPSGSLTNGVTGTLTFAVPSGTDMSKIRVYCGLSDLISSHPVGHVSQSHMTIYSITLS